MPLQECTFYADIHDAEQFDQVETLVQNAGFDAQLTVGKCVHGERERRTAPIALALLPQDIATCNLHMVPPFHQRPNWTGRPMRHSTPFYRHARTNTVLSIAQRRRFTHCFTRRSV